MAPLGHLRQSSFPGTEKRQQLKPNLCACRLQCDQQPRPPAPRGSRHPRDCFHPTQHRRCGHCAVDLPGELWQPSHHSYDCCIRYLPILLLCQSCGMIVCAVGCGSVMGWRCLQLNAALQNLHEKSVLQQAMGQSHQVHHSTPHDHTLLHVMQAATSTMQQSLAVPSQPAHWCDGMSR